VVAWPLLLFVRGEEAFEDRLRAERHAAVQAWVKAVRTVRDGRSTPSPAFRAPESDPESDGAVPSLRTLEGPEATSAPRDALEARAPAAEPARRPPRADRRDAPQTVESPSTAPRYRRPPRRF
jgi:hypothetical protein